MLVEPVTLDPSSEAVSEGVESSLGFDSGLGSDLGSLGNASAPPSTTPFDPPELAPEPSKKRRGRSQPVSPRPRKRSLRLAEMERAGKRSRTSSEGVVEVERGQDGGLGGLVNGVAVDQPDQTPREVNIEVADPNPLPPVALEQGSEPLEVESDSMLADSVEVEVVPALPLVPTPTTDPETSLFEMTEVHGPQETTSAVVVPMQFRIENMATCIELSDCQSEDLSQCHSQFSSPTRAVSQRRRIVTGEAEGQGDGEVGFSIGHRTRAKIWADSGHGHGHGNDLTRFLEATDSQPPLDAMTMLESLAGGIERFGGLDEEGLFKARDFLDTIGRNLTLAHRLYKM